MAEKIGEYYYTISADGKPVLNEVNKVEEGLEKVKKKGSEAGNFISKGFNSAKSSIANFFTAGLAVNAVTGMAKALFGAISQGLNRMIQQDKELSDKFSTIKGQFQSVFDGIASAIKPIVNWLADITTNLLKAIGIAQKPVVNPQLLELRQAKIDNLMNNNALKENREQITDEINILYSYAIGLYSMYDMRKKAILNDIKNATTVEEVRKYESELAFMDKVNEYFKKKAQERIDIKQNETKKIQQIESDGVIGIPYFNKDVFSRKDESKFNNGNGEVKLNGNIPLLDMNNMNEMVEIVNSLTDAFKKMGVEIPPEVQNIIKDLTSLTTTFIKMATTGQVSVNDIISIIASINTMMGNLTTSLNNMIFNNGIDENTKSFKNQGDVINDLNRKLEKYNQFLKTGSDYLSWLKSSGGSKEDQAKVLEKQLEDYRKKQTDIAKEFGLTINEDGSFNQDEINLNKNSIGLKIDNADNSQDWLREQTINDDWLHIGTRFSSDEALKIYLRKVKELWEMGLMSDSKYGELIRNTVENKPEQLKADVAFITTLYDEVKATNNKKLDIINEFTGLSSEIADIEKQYNDLLDNGNDLLLQRKKLYEDINKLTDYGLIDTENIYQQGKVIDEMFKAGYKGSDLLDNLSNLGFKNQIGTINIEVNEASGETVENSLNTKLLNLFK